MGARREGRDVIRVARPRNEPESLTIARDAALREVRPDGPKSRGDLPTTYKVAHAVLWKSQHSKCAYCEHREQSKRNDVDHFRPALRADRTPGSADTHGYWWLAYTWENLLFSCRNCNQAPAKFDRFPLEIGSVALMPEEPPPGREKPLLLDPAGGEDPTEHIEYFEERRPGTAARWTVRAREGSARGDATIRACKLDRADLVTLYTCHVDETLAKDRERIRLALLNEDRAGLREAWSDYAARHVRPSCIFAALSRDVLAADVPLSVRERFGLDLPAL